MVKDSGTRRVPLRKDLKELPKIIEVVLETEAILNLTYESDFWANVLWARSIH